MRGNATWSDAKPAVLEFAKSAARPATARSSRTVADGQCQGSRGRGWLARERRATVENRLPINDESGYGERMSDGEVTAPCLYSYVARKVYGAPDQWQGFEFRKLDGGTYVRGAVCTAVYKRGKRAGETNWSKLDKSTLREIVVTKQQLDEAEVSWEAETGRCVDCGGSGKGFVGWNTTNGRLTKPCKRCGETGKAPQS